MFRLTSSRRTLRHPLLRAAIGLLLAVSLWRGPLPWCHHHADGADAAATAELAWHLQWLHRGAGLVQGWHWHFSLPDDVDGDGRQDGESGEWAAGTLAANGDGRPLLEVLGASATVPASPLALLHTINIAADDGLSDRPPRRPDSERCFRSGPDVRLLACVARC